MPGSDLLGLRYEPPFPYITDYGPKGHTVLPGDFVSIEDGTGVVHTGAAFGEDDFRLASENGLTIHNPVRPDGTFDERDRPVRRHVRARRRRPDRRGAARVGPPVPGRRVRARLSALLALRHAAHLLRQDELVRAHDRASRRSCSPPTRRSTGTPSTSSTAASASGSRTTWTGRSRASATGARRCRSGAARTTSARRLRRLARRDPRARRHAAGRRAPPLRRRGRAALRGVRRRDAPRARPDRRLVGLGLHAVRAVARAVREPGRVRAAASRPTTSARGSTRRAAGSTRCSPCRCCCSAAPRTRRASASA